MARRHWIPAMEPTRSTSLTSSRAAELELADCWATFVKSLAIYPATNARVREHLQWMLAVFDEVVAKLPAELRGRVGLRLSRSELRVNGQKLDVRAHSNLPWLRERLERTLLAGVDFLAPLSPESVTRFSCQLLDHFTRKPLDLTFDQFWAESYAGIEPVPLRFDGSFAKQSEHESGGEVREGSDEAEVALAVEVSNERELEALLLSDVNVMARVERLRQLYEPATGNETETVELDLLARIIQVLPSEALRDFDVVVKVVTDTLDALEGRSRLGKLPSLSPGQVDLGRLLRTSSHRLFGRDEGPTAKGLVERALAAPSASAPVAEMAPKRVHASEAEITDDIDLLQAELEKLPRLDLPRAVADMEVSAEQINAYLTFLSRTDDPKHQAVIHRVLGELLPGATLDGLDVLRCHLAAHDGSTDPTAEQGMRRIEHFLKAKDLVSLARRCDFLQVDAIVERFPRRFVLFLLSLDFSVPDEASLADLVCRRVGGTRIHEAGPQLVADEKLLQWGLPERLLAYPSPGIAPLVRVILNEGTDEYLAGVAKYVLTTARTDPACCLLSVFEGAGSLPRKYLDELLVRVQELGDPAVAKPAGSSNEASKALGAYISRQLCRFLRETEGDAEATARRAYAVRFLASFRSAEGRQVLERIVSRRKMLLAPCEPRIVRRAAKRALWSY